MKPNIYPYHIYQNKRVALKTETMADNQTWTFKNQIGRFQKT